MTSDAARREHAKKWKATQSEQGRKAFSTFATETEKYLIYGLLKSLRTRGDAVGKEVRALLKDRARSEKKRIESRFKSNFRKTSEKIAKHV